MGRKIFVNLAVKDLQKSIAFFKALGFTFNAKFTDASGTCMIVSDAIYVMLLSHEKFASFLPPGHAIAGAKATEALISLSYDSREEVHALVEKAIAAGGREPVPMQDHGFMMERSFEDPDGHLWGIFWMDPKAAEG